MSGIKFGKVTLLPVNLRRKARESRWCWLARTCLHENRWPDMCAKDTFRKRLRRFKDACAMMIHNCKYRTDFNQYFCGDIGFAKRYIITMSPEEPKPRKKTKKSKKKRRRKKKTVDKPYRKLS